MCEIEKGSSGQKQNSWFNMNVFLAIATLCGLLSGYLAIPTVDYAASIVSEIFINMLKLVSLPIIFLSIVSTASGMESIDEIKILGKKVAKYTIITTLIAATIALTLFIVINPVRGVIDSPAAIGAQMGQKGYLDYLLKIIPSNFVQPFSENNVIGVLLMAMVLSFAALAIPSDHRKVLHTFFSSLYAAVVKITTWIIRLMPIAIWGFITMFIKDLRSGLEMKSIMLYLVCVILANLIQAFIVLPGFLKMKGISPMKTAKGMWPALSVAFFSKSSSAALPMTMKCAEENVGISRKVASFSLPLCTTINMNACAAFILTTVLFVSISNGMTFTPVEMVMWIFVATIAAIGNAGVPMGCYFLSSAFLAAMGVPLNILGIILPFYAMIDMLESAINVWSDACVTTVVQHELGDQVAELTPVPEKA